MSGSPDIPVPDDLVLVAHITGAYGVAGWVKLKAYSSDASALQVARTWWLDKPTLHDVEALQVRPQGDHLVARLMGSEDRNAAEALRGAAIYIRRAHFPPLDDNEFYWVDLIGHRVENTRGELLGVVAGLIDNGAHPILQVETVAMQPDTTDAPGKRGELLIPFVDQFVINVVPSEKKISVDWESDY